MSSSTIECPCCCNACGNADECCSFDGEPTFEPECYDICEYKTEGDDGGYPTPNMFTQTVTRASNTPNCESCEQQTEQEVQGCKECPCECSWIGDEWTSTRPTDCKTVETRVVSSNNVGLPAGGCLTVTCYRCLENDGDCSECVYDGAPTFEPECTAFCCWEPFTQTVRRGSTTPGCENCYEETIQEVTGCDSTCECDCSFLGPGWQPSPPKDCDNSVEQDVYSQDAGCGITGCVSQTCHKCDEGEEGCFAVVNVSGGVVGNPTCKTFMNANWDNACRFGSMREAAEMGASVSLSVVCPERDFCEGKVGTSTLQDCSFGGAGTNSVTYKFEDCGLNDPDFEITITLEECPPEECLGPNS